MTKVGLKISGIRAEKVRLPCRLQPPMKLDKIAAIRRQAIVAQPTLEPNAIQERFNHLPPRWSEIPGVEQTGAYSLITPV